MYIYQPTLDDELASPFLWEAGSGQEWDCLPTQLTLYAVFTDGVGSPTRGICYSQKACSLC